MNKILSCIWLAVLLAKNFYMRIQVVLVAGRPFTKQSIAKWFNGC